MKTDEEYDAMVQSFTKAIELATKRYMDLESKQKIKEREKEYDKTRPKDENGNFIQWGGTKFICKKRVVT